MTKQSLRETLEKEWLHGTVSQSGLPWTDSSITNSSPIAQQEFPMIVQIEKETDINVSPHHEWKSVEIGTDAFAVTFNANELKALAAEFIKLADLLDNQAS